MVCLAALVLLRGGMPFSPGPLSAENPQGQPIQELASHAEFESRCDLCHTPFRGPDASLCVNCHGDVANQISTAQGVHGSLPEPQKCAACHPDHKGRAASLTRTSLVELPHNQFGFALNTHQRDYDGAALTCRSCHGLPIQSNAASAAVALSACVDCHALRDALFVADHRRKMGDTCLACHDGTARLQGFDHAKVFPLEQKHAPVPCVKCHVNNRFRGTPRECVQCHQDPQVHRGQFSANCAACHTAAGWRPARLIQHRFPLNHGNKGKESECKVCHPANYAAYTCHNCHEHNQAKTAQQHVKPNVRDYRDCIKCHATGKKVE
ncbi:MAG: hypothetical protein HY782_15405 [Chloroflexi bacterium]|nr:hypothetical protein [Chloroflexota bacterium]